MLSRNNCLLLGISSLSLIACAQGEFSAESLADISKQQTSYIDSSSPSSSYTSGASSSSSSSQSSNVSTPPASSSSSSGSSQSSSSSTGSSTYTPPASSSSSTSGSTSSNVATSSMPTKKCMNSSSGGLDFRLDTTSANRTHVLRLISLPSSMRGSVEAIVVYEGANGLRFDRDPSEPFINNEADDNFWQCGISFSLMESMAKARGYSSLSAAIPNAEVRLKQLREPQAGERLAGIALKSSDKVWSMQCF